MAALMVTNDATGTLIPRVGRAKREAKSGTKRVIFDVFHTGWRREPDRVTYFLIFQASACQRAPDRPAS